MHTLNLDRRRLLGATALAALAACAPLSLASGQAGPATARLILLGTQGGPNATAERSEASSALQVGERLYLVDCGYGALASMAPAGLNVRALDAIFLTHLHDDHTADLMAILTNIATAGRARDLVVYGPPGTDRLVDGLRMAMAPNADIRSADEVRATGFLDFLKSAEVEEGVPFLDDGTVQVRAARNSHYPDYNEGLNQQRSFAYRFDWGQSVVFSGDTTYSENLVALARGADVFVCEVIEPNAMRRAFDAMVEQGVFNDNPEGVLRHILETHSTPDQVGRMAAEAGVGRVVLNHLAPGALDNLPDSDYTDGVKAHFDGPVMVSVDGMVVAI